MGVSLFLSLNERKSDTPHHVNVYDRIVEHRGGGRPREGLKGTARRVQTGHLHNQQDQIDVDANSNGIMERSGTEGDLPIRKT